MLEHARAILALPEHTLSVVAKHTRATLALLYSFISLLSALSVFDLLVLLVLLALKAIELLVLVPSSALVPPCLGISVELSETGRRTPPSR